MDPEGGIFTHQLVEGRTQLVLIRLRLGLDRHRNHGRRELDRLQDDGFSPIADRVAGADILQADGGSDITAKNLLDLLALVGVHLEEPADALHRVARGVEDGTTRLQLAGVDTEERQLTDKRVRHDLENQA